MTSASWTPQQHGWNLASKDACHSCPVRLLDSATSQLSVAWPQFSKHQPNHSQLERVRIEREKQIKVDDGKIMHVKRQQTCQMTRIVQNNGHRLAQLQASLV